MAQMEQSIAHDVNTGCKAAAGKIQSGHEGHDINGTGSAVRYMSFKRTSA